MLPRDDSNTFAYGHCRRNANGLWRMNQMPTPHKMPINVSFNVATCVPMFKTFNIEWLSFRPYSETEHTKNSNHSIAQGQTIQLNRVRIFTRNKFHHISATFRSYAGIHNAFYLSQSEHWTWSWDELKRPIGAQYRTAFLSNVKSVGSSVVLVRPVFRSV